jgi:hypothetical protein
LAWILLERVITINAPMGRKAVKATNGGNAEAVIHFVKEFYRPHKLIGWYFFPSLCWCHFSIKWRDAVFAFHEYPMS